MKRILKFIGCLALGCVGLTTLAGNVAMVGETEYATFEGAYAKVPAGGTITLIDNAAMTQQITNTGKGRKFTVDLNGKTLTVNSGLYTFHDITFKNGKVAIGNPTGAAMGDPPWVKVFYVEGNAKIAPVTLTWR